MDLASSILWRSLQILLEDGWKLVLLLLIVSLHGPIVAWLALVRYNRCKGKGIHVLARADRFLEVYRKKEIPSPNSRYNLAMTFVGHSAPVISTIDQALERWKLVQRFERNGQWFVKRKDGIFRLYCWSAYFTCIALLIIFFGDKEGN